MKYTVLVLFLFTLFLSCDKLKSKSEPPKEEPYIEYVYLPDTVYRNVEFNGELKINMNYGVNLNKPRITKRYLFLYVTTENVEPLIDSIKKVDHKIFTDMTGNGLIKFKTHFNELGQNIITVILEDVKFIEHDTLIDRTPINKTKTSIIVDVFVVE